MKHLIIGDAHVKPGQSLERFEWLAKFCIEHKPDVIVDLGDWEDMPSLSSYDIGKKSYEGRSYVADIESARQARILFQRGLEEFNESCRKRHTKGYYPTKIALGGNHFEGRINRAIELDRKLEGLINIHDGAAIEFGWDYIPFLEPVAISGIMYSHYFTSGVMGRAISGEHPGYGLVTKQHCTCVQGHSHLLDMTSRTKPNGDRIWGIHAGCFLAEDQWEDYAGPANKMWSRGILLLDNVHEGDFDSFTWTSVNRLKELYG